MNYYRILKMKFEDVMMKSSQPVAVVSGALALVLRVSRLWGVAPLTLVKQRGGWRASISYGYTVYGIILLSAMNLLTVIGLLWDYSLEPSRSVRMRSATRRAVWIIDAVLLMTISMLGALTAPRQMRSLIGCLNLLQKINNELKIIRCPRPSERNKCIMFATWTLITVVITLVDHVLITVSASQENVALCLVYSSYYGCYWVLQLLVMQFVMITMHILHSFRALNENLRVLLQAEHLKLKRPIHETVRWLANTYLSICDVVKEVDARNGLILMLHLASFFLHLIITPYYLFNNLSSKCIDCDKKVVDTLLQITWCFFHTANLMILIEPCHLTIEEIGVTRELTSRLMRYTSSPEEPLAVALDLFFKHLVLNNVSYSPLNVTTLTRSLVTAIVGSITTYLVVIIQL